MKKTFTYLLGGVLCALFLIPSSAEAQITAKWDWANSKVATGTYQNTTASLASDVSGVNLFVDATVSGAKLASNAGNAQFNVGTKLHVPVVSTKDVVIVVANSFNFSDVTLKIGNTTVSNLTTEYNVTESDVIQGYVVIHSFATSDPAKQPYLNSIQVDLAYMPVSTVTAKWDWVNNIPTGIQTTATVQNNTSTINSNIDGISLYVDAKASGAKLQSNVGNAQFNLGTILHVLGVVQDDILTVESNSYNFEKIRIGGNDYTDRITKYIVTAADASQGYVEIVSVSNTADKHPYLNSITVEKLATVKIGDTGWATYSNILPTDFSSLAGVVNAYQVTGFTGTAINKASVSGTVAASTGLLLNATSGTYAIPLVASGDDLSSTNQLVAQTSAGTVTAAGTGYRNYVLVAPGGTVAFKSITGDNSASIGAGKAYLHLDISGGEPGANFLYFNDETTGVNKVKDQVKEARGDFFDLQGRKVAQPTKGLYIVNGKKVIIK